ncbi:MAG: DUF3084 domain-containing protein [Candidatus Margulisiibacteriota bacterium]
MTYQFAIRFIFILIVVSGAVAYIGNYVGRYFGKKRLSLFGLRPRYTAIAFTIISGVLIAILTFGMVIYTSKDARTAFFGLEKLRTQITDARNQINNSKKELDKQTELLKRSEADLEKTRAEITALLATREKLKNEVEMAASRKVLYTAGEVIYRTLLKGGQNKEKAEMDINQALIYLNKDLSKYKTAAVNYDRSDYDSTVSYLANMDSAVILRIISNKNLTVGGNPLVRFDVSINQLLYHKGEEIQKGFISGKLTQSETEQRVKELFSKAEKAARIKGVMPDLTGSISISPYDKIYETARRIRGYGTLTKVTVQAAADIYTYGPLDADFKVQP